MESETANPVANADWNPVPIAGWLLCFGLLTFFRSRFGERLRPEMLAVLGALGWLAVGPIFAVAVAIGLAWRLFRLLRPPEGIR